MKKKKEKLINKDKSFMDAVIRGVYKFFESPFKKGVK